MVKKKKQWLSFDPKSFPLLGLQYDLDSEH